MARCSIHVEAKSDPHCPMCVQFYGIAPAPREPRDNGPTPSSRTMPNRRERPAEPLPPERMTTLESLPNHRIVRVCGLVSYVSSDSGWTASTKGNNALEGAFQEIGRQGRSLQADAIVGVSISAFGARGGVTSMVGGDAVGIAIVGTAVVTEPLEEC